MSRLIHCLPAAIALAALSAAPRGPIDGAARDAMQDASRWTVSERPLVSIGDNGGDTLIVRPGGALMLLNGAILVASRRTSRIEWFDESGRYVKTIARKGQGPGEFAGAIAILGMRGDTILARDIASKRYNYFATSGAFLRTDTLGDRRHSAWVYDRTVVYGAPLNTDFTKLAQTLTRIPHTGDSARSARIDRAGNVWIRSGSDRRAFTIFAPDARHLGAITLPERFEPLQILDTLILGRWTDADDLDRIHLYRLTPGRTPSAPPGAPLRTPYDQTTTLVANKAIVDRMKSAIMKTFSAQEDFFATQGRYATRMSDLPADAVPAGFRVALFDVQRNVFALLITHPSTRLSCATTLAGVMAPGETILCG